MAEALEPVPQARVSASTPNSTNRYLADADNLHEVYVYAAWLKVVVASQGHAPTGDVDLLDVVHVCYQVRYADQGIVAPKTSPGQFDEQVRPAVFRGGNADADIIAVGSIGQDDPGWGEDFYFVVGHEERVENESREAGCAVAAEFALAAVSFEEPRGDIGKAFDFRLAREDYPVGSDAVASFAERASGLYRPVSGKRPPGLVRNSP